MNDSKDNVSFGAVARNKRGRLGIVLGHSFDHKNNGKPFKFHGIGLCGGSWKSREVPVLVAKNVKAFLQQQ